MNRFHINTCIVCGENDFNEYLTCIDHHLSGEYYALQKCLNCGFIFTQDIPSEDQIGNYYKAENYISHSDTRSGLTSKLYHVARKWMLRRKRKLVESFIKKGKILDLGAGTGYFLNEMKQAAWETTGIEPSSDARRVCTSEF